MISGRLHHLQHRRFLSLCRGHSCGSRLTDARYLSTLSHVQAKENIPSLFYLSNGTFHRLSQQRYMGRKDGNKAFNKVRPPTRKQMKKYRKRMREMHHHKVGRHSKPGSKAGPRREYLRNEFEFLIDSAKGKIPREPTPEELDYNYGDALVDDLIGNSAHLMSTPTPKPVYLGRQHGIHHANITKMMEDYREHLKLIDSSKDEAEKNLINIPPLPNDKQVGLLLRSYRDKNSTKWKPLGIVKALKYLIKEVGVPTTLFEKKTYAALVSCSNNETEARRIMKMMQENGQQIDAYIYSILIDIHAQRGDFRSANGVLTEMQMGGIQPTLPTYTSLLAACYKAVNKASTPQQIKAEAGDLAWEKWKECRINGLEPDAMAYGSIIRIFAARGLAERAINMVEEMQMMEVKPTTLIFTSALRAVARSHARALRFEGGKNKRNKHRETITSHHGRMTRKIVIMAEQAGVEQDNGYIQALMLCAATAGDSSTVKAIYLANEVRKLEDLRTIGGPEHLQLIRGKLPRADADRMEALEDGLDEAQQIGAESSVVGQDEALAEVDSNSSHMEKSMFNKKGPRSRRDTRILSALLKANANALENRGLGNMWEGRENKGYLCENSLRWISMRYKPKYIDRSIPGVDAVDSMIWDDEDVEKIGKRLRRKKFMGLIDDSIDNEVGDFDPIMHRMSLHEEDDEQKGNEIPFEMIDYPREDGKKEEQEMLEKELYANGGELEGGNEEMMAELNLDKTEQNGESYSHEFPSRETQSEDVSLKAMEERDCQISELGEDADNLDLVLYGMPQQRIQQVRDEFKANLGTPSLIKLVPLLRENMPEVISKTWLVNKNLRDAEAVMLKAEEDNVVDIHVMNSMLQVLAKSNKIDETLEFYDSFAKRNTRQNSVTDRTVFQMLVDRNQISRALEFKENRVEKNGKHIDLLSYGSLIEYYGKKDQLGSAMMSIKECVRIHGSPPGEKSLKQIRLLCRQKEITEEVGLVELIGDDPLEWLRRGESTYKREYSKKGNSQTMRGRNRILDI